MNNRIKTNSALRTNGDDGTGYDVFLSCKSADNAFAKTVATLLESRGLKVFFGRETLPVLGSDEYREKIDEAIDKAQHMIVIASKGSHLNAKWVKYEWGLFLGEKLAGRKDGNLITILAGPLTVHELPIALRNREAIPLVPGEIQRVVDYVRAPVRKSREGVDAAISWPVPTPDMFSLVDDSPDLSDLGGFAVGRKTLLRYVSWTAADEETRKMRTSRKEDWRLPTIEQLKVIRKASIFPDHFCYWSREEIGDHEARYLHFDDGHSGTGPKSFKNGLCAVLVREQPDQPAKANLSTDIDVQIISRLLSEHQEIVMSAYSKLQGTEKDVYRAILVDKLSSPTSNDRVAAIQSLYWTRDRDLPALLTKLAKDESKSVRRRVAHFLGTLRHRDALSVVNELCFDKSPDVRATARRAYEKITGQKLASGDGL